MTQRVKVLRTFADGTAQVVHVRQSACSGDCHQCAGCGAAQETLILTAQNPIGAAAGDVVMVESASSPVLKAAAVVYILPLFLFFAGYFVGSLLWERGGIVGCLAFVLGIGGGILYDRLAAGKRKTVYTITAFAREG